MKKFILSIALGLAVSTTAFAAPAPTQARLSFSGGDYETPLSITLETPLLFNFYASSPAPDIYYVLFADVFDSLTSESFLQGIDGMTTSLNEAPSLPMDGLGYVNSFGTGSNDLVLFNVETYLGAFVEFNMGDTLELASGTITAGQPMLGLARPSDGLYDVYLVTDGRDFLPVSITAVPEPSTYALIAGGVVLAGVMIRRRKQRSNAA